MDLVNSRESTVEQRVVRWAEKNGVPSLKLELQHNAGWPDRVFLLPGGRAVFIEFKRKGEKPRKLQDHRIMQLTLLGFEVTWTDNSGDAIAFLKRHLGSA